MRIKIKVNENNPRHTRFTIFIDGANCGKLCMISTEAFAFFNILHHGADAANVNLEYENIEGKLFGSGN